MSSHLTLEVQRGSEGSHLLVVALDIDLGCSKVGGFSSVSDLSRGEKEKSVLVIEGSFFQGDLHCGLAEHRLCLDTQRSKPLTIACLHSEMYATCTINCCSTVLAVLKHTELEMN